MKSGVAIAWRLKKQYYTLQGSRCPTCQQRHFPPRPTEAMCCQKLGLTHQGANDSLTEGMTLSIEHTYPRHAQPHLQMKEA